MGRDTPWEIDAESVDHDPDTEIPESARIYPLIGDTGNRRVLTDWLADHDSYEAVDSGADLSDAEFDVCIVDEETFRQYGDELRTAKADARPVLLPVLLLLPETSGDVIETDRGDVADNVLSARVDEIVSLPIRQTELEWRLRALLRLRSHSVASQRQNETLRLFYQALESSGHAVYITTPDGTIRYVNPAFEEITGFTREEAVGETTRLLRSGEMSEEYYAALWDTVQSGEVWDGEIIDQRRNGEQYVAEQTIAPVSQDGEIRAFVAVQTDVTERNERQERLQRRTHAIDEAPVGITISDPKREDNPLIYVNDAFVAMTGYPREDALGRNCRFLQGENTSQDRVARIREAIDAQEPISLDIRNYRKDGTEFWNHLEVAPVRNDAGDVVSYIGFQQDVTERRERHRQLGILDRVLRHNLRNGMNVVQGQAETIQSRTDGRVAASARQIVDKSEQMIQMAEKEQQVTELLREEPTHEEIDLCDRLQQVASSVGAEHPDAAITVDCPDDATVHAMTQFAQAIRELVTNAVVHNDSSSPEVAISVTRTDGTVRIEVADHGPRIPEMERDFLDSDAEQTPLYHGSGLGLWLVQLITSRSGGVVTFEENSPAGNVVGIELPE